MNRTKVWKMYIQASKEGDISYWRTCYTQTNMLLWMTVAARQAYYRVEVVYDSL